MLTISGMHKGETKLTIPNQVVREQLYTYLLNTYNEADLSFSNHEKDELSSALAYDGAWQSYFDYIADCLIARGEHSSLCRRREFDALDALLAQRGVPGPTLTVAGLGHQLWHSYDAMSQVSSWLPASAEPARPRDYPGPPLS